MIEPAPRWHTISPEEVARALSADLSLGLTPEQVARARAQHGPNTLPKPPRQSALAQFVAQFINPLVGTLLAAAVVAVLVANSEAEQGSSFWSRYSDAFAILLIVVVNAIIGFVQERKAEKALDALERMAAPRCRVIREGRSAVIDAAELVPGDLVELAEGDHMPADLRLTETASFEAVEGALTGESEAVAKDARAIVAAEAVDGDQRNMAFMGTTAIRGAARAVVVATGANTRLGRIGRMMTESTKPKSPLEERLEDFGRKILILCGIISAILFAVGLARGGRWHELLLVAVSVAVAAIPEGLPAITTITLALGMQRMARRNAIVRKLPAVETLGAVGIIGSDKTGTLTRNEMTVRCVWVAGTEYEVTGTGYEPEGHLLLEGQTLPSVPEAIASVVHVGLVANTASLRHGPDGSEATGDPTEAALLAFGDKLGLERPTRGKGDGTADLHLPFDSDRKRMSWVLPDGDGFVAHVKGAPDRVLQLCSHMMGPNGPQPLDEAGRAAVSSAIEALSGRALRVLALASRRGGSELLGQGLDHAQKVAFVEQDLVLLGLVGMLDPPRDEVRDAIADCKHAGIRVIMITGDHKLTATAIAHDLGLWEAGDAAITGEELDRLTDEALSAQVRTVRVFARVSPEHKLRIVRALQSAPNHLVAAMTGDGVNDAPAIRESAIGVAMGKNGTDVARQAADIVLADDNFATIVEAVREGRAIFANIQKSIYFLLSSNAGLVMTVFVTSFFEDMPPLTPIQILWINLVTNGLPALALGVDPPESNVMAEPPRKPGTPFLGRHEWLDIVWVGLLMGASAVTIYLLPLWPEGLGVHEITESKRTMVFSVLALAPLFHAFNCRSLRQPFFGRRAPANRYLWGAVAASALVHLIALAVPPLQPIFHSDHHWTWLEAAIVLGFAALPIPVVEAAKRLTLAARRRH